MTSHEKQSKNYNELYEHDTFFYFVDLKHSLTRCIDTMMQKMHKVSKSTHQRYTNQYLFHPLNNHAPEKIMKKVEIFLTINHFY
jgi:hypothetical protein